MSVTQRAKEEKVGNSSLRRDEFVLIIIFNLLRITKLIIYQIDII